MPNLSIKNVPETVVEKLRQRAASHHRSLQGELMDLICRCADEDADAAASAAIEGDSSGWLSIEEVAAELAEFVTKITTRGAACSRHHSTGT